MLFFCPGAPSGSFDTSKGRLQKETQTVCVSEERPAGGRGSESGMQDGGEEEGRGCPEVGTGAERWACETRRCLTGDRGHTKNSQGEEWTVSRRASQVTAFFLFESDARDGGEDSG